MQGWVFHSHYVGWLDDSLLELWSARIGPYTAFSAAGNEYVVAEISVRFLAGARFEDEVEIAIELEALTRTSLTALFAVRSGERQLVEAKVRAVCLGSEGKEPWPDEVRTAFAPLLPTPS
jgi:acyl-CoA thioester hydrolase